MMTGLQSSELLYSSVTTLLIITAFIIGTGIFILIAAIIKHIKRDEIKVNERKKQLRKTTKAADAGISSGEQSKQNSSVILDQIKKLSFTEKLGEKLLDADIMVKPEEFIGIWFGSALVLPLFLLLFTGNLLLSLIVLVACVILPDMYIRSKKRKKIQLFDDQLADALLMISNSLIAGLSFQQAMENIAREMPNPIAAEFGRVVREMRFGKTLERAITDMMLRIKSDDLMIAMNAVLIQHQVGGNLSEILETIAETVKDRRQIKKDIKVITAQGRYSGLIIALLPIILCLILSVMNPGYIAPLFTTPLGIVMIIIAVIMEIIGLIMINKIVNVEY